MTLVFLGSRDEDEIGAVAETGLGALERLSHVSLTPREAKGLPRRAPRLLALDLLDEGRRAERVHAAASGALAGAGLYESESRPFWPHVTLARVRRGSGRAAPGGLGGLELPPPPAQPIPARKVTLYRSRPTPQGARYEALASRSLG